MENEVNMLYKGNNLEYQISKTYYEETAKKILENISIIYENIPICKVGNEYTISGHYCEKPYGAGSDGKARKTERRYLSCLLTRANKGRKACCAECIFKDDLDFNKSKCDIIDRELPVSAEGCGLGKIDLFMKFEGELYFCEVKPPQGNAETLLRMVLEIETYCYEILNNNELQHQYNKIYTEYFSDVLKVKKAIMFYEGTEQFNEYYELLEKRHNAVNTKKLMINLGIDAFVVKIKDNKYIIEKA